MRKSTQDKINKHLDKINAADRVCNNNDLKNPLYLRILEESRIEYQNEQKNKLNGIFKEKKKR